MQAEAPRIVVVTAALNDWESVQSLLPLVDQEFGRCECRGVFVVVDDGSSEAAHAGLFEHLALSHVDRVEVVTLHRNLGNQRAVAIGLAHTTENVPGEYYLLMDCDHEDDPKYIPQLFARCRAEDSGKIVFATRAGRSEGRVFTILYKSYQCLYRLLTGHSIAFGNFSIMPASIARRIAHIGELWNHFPAAVMRARLPFDTIEAVRGRRLYGASKMNLPSLLLHAISGFAVHADIVAVRILCAIGIVAAGAIVLGLVFLALKLFTDVPVVGWTSQILGLIFVFLGQIFVMVCVLVFMLASMRLQLPNIPAVEYRKYVHSVSTVWRSRE